MKSTLGKRILVAASMIVMAGCSMESTGTGTFAGGLGDGRGSAWESEFNRGKESLASGYFGLALQQFKATLGMNPQSVRALNAVAVTYDRLGRYDLAALYYDRALALEPESVTTLNNVGYSLLTQERYEEALIYFERALVQRHGPADARMIAANRKMALDRLQVARQRKGGHDVASAAAPVERLRADCRDQRSPAVGRTGERVFALVTTRAVSTFSEPPCGNGGGMRVAMLHTQAPAQSPEPAVAQQPAAPAKLQIGATLAARPAPPPLQTVTRADAPLKVEVSNGAGRNKLAARMRSYFASKGLPVSYLTNAASFKNRSTAIFYKPGHRPAAERFAKQLPIPVELREVTETYADIRIRLGADILEFDTQSLYAAKHGERNA